MSSKVQVRYVISDYQGRVMTGQDSAESGQITSGQNRICQGKVRSSQVRTRSGQIRSCQVKTGQAWSGKIRLG